MRIAFIGQKGLPAANGGVERHTENLAVRLAEMGHKIFVYAKNDYTEKTLGEYKGVKLIHIPSVSVEVINKILYSFLSNFHAAFQKYDIIHFQSKSSAFFSFIPKIFRIKTAIILTFRRRRNYKKSLGWLGKELRRYAEQLAVRIASKIIVLKKSTRDYIFNKYKIKAAYIPEGSEVRRNLCSKVLERWNLKEKRYVIADGSLCKNEEIKTIVEAFKNLEDTNKIPNNFKLVIIDSDFNSNDRKNIIFTDNPTNATLEQLFSHSYLFIAPSESENSSATLLEAMGYGIAPLVSDIPKNLEAIGKCGFSFKSKSGEDLKEKLAYLVNKPSEVERMGKMAREKAQKDYGWDKIVRKTLHIYEFCQKETQRESKRLIIESKSRAVSLRSWW
ncbi:MAG: glycosyltransferase family 4 protein [bacterium]|nr:glycosyltransferase family 4 protein [bacterium]